MTGSPARSIYLAVSRSPHRKDWIPSHGKGIKPGQKRVTALGRVRDLIHRAEALADRSERRLRSIERQSFWWSIAMILATLSGFFVGSFWGAIKRVILPP